MGMTLLAAAYREDTNPSSGGGRIIAALFGGVLFIVWLAVIVLVFVSLWKLFEKAGKPGWAGIVPIYNAIVLLEIVGRPLWWIVLLLVPCLNFVVGIMLCLDVEPKIRGDGPWVQDWLSASGAGLYGNAPVFTGRRAAFYVLAWYPKRDPARTWIVDPRYPRPNGPCGWQWRGTHTEFGRGVDRGWYDDWFAPQGAAAAPAFPYPAADYLALLSADPHCHSGKDPAEQASVSKWQAKMAERGWSIHSSGTFDGDSDRVCRQFQRRSDR